MFNESLKEIRTQSGMSQKALAEKLFVSQQTVAKWETGKATPNPDMVVKLAEIFHVTTDELLGNEAPEVTQTINSPESILNDVEFAFYGEIKDFTEEEKQDLIDFVQFIKSKRKDN